MDHILPKEYISTLSTLQDRALARQYNEIEQLMVEEFGKKPDVVFKTFERVPLAAASLAQVHHATTHDGYVSLLLLGFRYCIVGCIWSFRCCRMSP